MTLKHLSVHLAKYTYESRRLSPPNVATKQQQVMTINKQKVEFCHFLTRLIGHKRAKEELLLAIRRLANLENPAGGCLYQLIGYAQMLQYVNDLEQIRKKDE